jgi:hypothetical protein
MIGKLVRVGVVFVMLGAMTGCEGCDKKKDPPVPVTSGPSSQPPPVPVTGVVAPSRGAWPGGAPAAWTRWS